MNNLETNGYRLINAEGDGLSGLIVDIYGDCAVIQCHTVGMYTHIQNIAKAIEKIYGPSINTVYDKNKLTNALINHHLKGDEDFGVINEHGHQFKVNWVKGQKTGFFLDQRDNRKLLEKYAHGKSVLNTFCYTGGFSVYAMCAGATSVDSVDSSSSAIEMTKENMDLNSRGSKCMRNEIVGDVMKYLGNTQSKYDILIVDPPAFAKSQRKRHNAVQAYKRLNTLAMKKVRSNGMVFTFSCSQVVNRTLFNDTIRSAAIEAGREIQILHYLSQPSDHPSNIFHPEGSYLKGLVLHVI